jgi:hypothetical protein
MGHWNDLQLLPWLWQFIRLLSAWARHGGCCVMVFVRVCSCVFHDKLTRAHHLFACRHRRSNSFLLKEMHFHALPTKPFCNALQRPNTKYTQMRLPVSTSNITIITHTKTKGVKCTRKTKNIPKHANQNAS